MKKLLAIGLLALTGLTSTADAFFGRGCCGRRNRPYCNSSRRGCNTCFSRCGDSCNTCAVNTCDTCTTTVVDTCDTCDVVETTEE